MDFLILCLSLLVPTILGAVILDIFFMDRFGFWEKIFLGFGIGFGIFTLEMFYQSLFGIHFNISTFLIFFLILAGSLLVWKKDVFLSRGSFFSFKTGAAPQVVNNLLSAFLFFLIALITAKVFLETFFIAIDLWDSWANWSFKAKVYFVEGIIPFDKYKLLATAWGCWDYPHHVPLMEAWIMLFLGYWNDQLPRLIFPIFFSGLVFCSYTFFRRYVHQSAALAGVFFVVSLPALQITTIGTISEPALLFYYMVSVFFLLRWIEEGQLADFILSAVLIGLAGWTKNEGSVYFLFNFFVVLFFLKKSNCDVRHKMFQAVSYGFIFLLIAGPWWVIKMSWGLKNWIVNSDHLTALNILANVSGFPVYLSQMAVCMGAFFFVWPMFLIFFLIDPRENFFSKKYILFMILCHMGMILAVACINPREMLLSVNMVRLLLAPSLLAIVYVIMVLGRPSREQP